MENKQLYAELHGGPNQFRNHRLPISDVSFDLPVPSYVDGFVGTLVYRYNSDRSAGDTVWYDYVECVPSATHPDEPEPVTPHLAREILVDRDARGAPRVSIDGEVLPWYTDGIVVPAPSLQHAPTVTVTFIAERVAMVNDMDFPRTSGD